MILKTFVTYKHYNQKYCINMFMLFLIAPKVYKVCLFVFDPAVPIYDNNAIFR